MTPNPRCIVCAAGAIDTEATHRCYARACCPPCLLCDRHTLPGDVPLAEAVRQSRQNVWTGHDEPQGLEGETCE